MAEPVEIRTRAWVIQPATCRLNVTFHYDPSEPYAVMLTLAHTGEEGERWVLDRDLLRDGMTRLVGPGDVQVFPFTDPPGVGLYLTDAQDFMLLRLPTGAVARFLARSYIAVPAGAEWVDVDAAVAALLSEATP